MLKPGKEHEPISRDIKEQKMETRGRKQLEKQPQNPKIITDNGEVYY